MKGKARLASLHITPSVVWDDGEFLEELEVSPLKVTGDALADILQRDRNVLAEMLEEFLSKVEDSRLE